VLSGREVFSVNKTMLAFVTLVIAIVASIQIFMSLPAYGTAAPDSEQAVPAFNCHNLFYKSDKFSF